MISLYILNIQNKNNSVIKLMDFLYYTISVSSYIFEIHLCLIPKNQYGLIPLSKIFNEITY